MLPVVRLSVAGCDDQPSKAASDEERCLAVRVGACLLCYRFLRAITIARESFRFMDLQAFSPVRQTLDFIILDLAYQ